MHPPVRTGFGPHAPYGTNHHHHPPTTTSNGPNAAELPPGSTQHNHTKGSRKWTKHPRMTPKTQVNGANASNDPQVRLGLVSLLSRASFECFRPIRTHPDKPKGARECLPPCRTGMANRTRNGRSKSTRGAREWRRPPECTASREWSLPCAHSNLPCSFDALNYSGVNEVVSGPS